MAWRVTNYDAGLGKDENEQNCELVTMDLLEGRFLLINTLTNSGT